MKKYTLTDEHRAQIPAWRDRWIANAMRTRPMDDTDRAAMRVAIRGLYEAAGLTPPPDHRIVFVPSPFVARFAGGIAAAIWWRRSHSSTAATHDATYAATTDATTEATRAATSAATSAATHAATHDAIRAATRAATDVATHDATDEATYAATYAATRAATDVATDEATDDATSAATSAATDVATDEATYAATDEATYAATHDATYAATRAATDVATYAATTDATDEATYAAADAATTATTRAATYVATTDATDEATYAATDAIDDDVHWWRVPHMASIVAFARRVTGGELGVLCAQWAWRMSQGGNQWSAWVAFLSFFRHVAQLPLDYSKWDHWERAAIHGGLRIMHRDFCIVSDFPETLLVDAENRPHCDTGPFCRWRDGSALYAVHGVRVPAWLVEHPERLTADHITRESNAEVRRVMLERYGADRYIRDIGAVALDASDFGTLYQVPLGDDEPLTMVRVTNSTPEPDGSYKDYWLRVHPELRPMRRGEYVGHAQAMTALNAVASTFGLTGREYVLSFQS